MILMNENLPHYRTSIIARLRRPRLAWCIIKIRPDHETIRPCHSPLLMAGLLRTPIAARAILSLFLDSECRHRKSVLSPMQQPTARSRSARCRKLCSLLETRSRANSHRAPRCRRSAPRPQTCVVQADTAQNKVKLRRRSRWPHTASTEKTLQSLRTAKLLRIQAVHKSHPSAPSQTSPQAATHQKTTSHQLPHHNLVHWTMQRPARSRLKSGRLRQSSKNTL